MTPAASRGSPEMQGKARTSDLQVDHQALPARDRPWVMRMSWRDLLFAHWPVRADALRPFIPKPLELDTFDGWAWIGIVPFLMSRVRPRLVPASLAMEFLELNVRTYVTTPGRSGVWFFSLDATSRLAVRAARAWYGLPYFDATIDERTQDGVFSFSSSRTHRGSEAAELLVRYRPVGPEFASVPGSLDHWLTERYFLYGADRRGRPGYGEVHHRPWPLQRAEAEFSCLRMTEQLGFRLTAEEPILHFSADLDVRAWPMHRIS